MHILVAGDYCPHGRVNKLLECDQYDTVFGDIIALTKDSDYSILNLECPVVEHEAKPIDKCGPNLKCTTKAVNALKWAGFDCVTLANNHFYDYGEVGVKDTLEALKSNKIDFVGGGKNLSEASSILYVVIGQEVLSVINCCEHEFSIANENTGGSNPLNPIQQYYSIQAAKKKAKYVIVIVHGGFEHYQLPSHRMKETYRFFVDAGADVVINHHQHCYSGFEVYNGKPIFYGLGNFCFDWEGKRNGKWNEGFMVKLDFSYGVKFDMIPYLQGNAEPGVKVLSERAVFEENIGKLNSIISDDMALEKVNNEYLRKCMSGYIFCFEPLYNKLTEGLVNKGILPSFIRRRRSALIDYITNESHIEKVVMTIKEALKK